MKRGCLANILFIAILFVVFGGSTYFWFNFFVRGTSLPTPNLIGKSVSQARAVCSDLGVNLTVDPKAKRNSDKVPAGFVVWQNRDPGNTNLIKRGTTLRVELSAGPLVIRVPDLDGTSAGTAVLRLGQQNLKLGNLAYADAAANANGIVAADPPNGTVVPAQTPVSLLVSVPPAPSSYVMPDLIDHPLDEIRGYIEGHGLKIATVKFEAYPGIRDGIIIRQFPLRGAPVSAREAISVVVSKQEEGIIEQPTSTQ
ncbi:MAG TPA: PASTA domain-containing protein [Thermoanaerobaculia bacterium]|jgi:serine/threonine-protein kinase|nr:PASTA domain-containing protein [Thermoanaerobaculia bacterium]